MTRTIVLFLLVACTTTLSVCRADPQPPNVVFIMVDDLGWSDVGFNGSEVYETPNADGLASQGMVFSDFYSGGPVCSPTRASIMTGKYTARTGITTYLLSPTRDAKHVQPYLPLEEFTIAEAFKKNGYATGYFGKWHLGYENDFWAGNQGFDVAKGGIDLPWAWTLCYPGIEEAPTAKTWPKTHTRFFSPYHLTHLENGPDDEYLTERLTNETIGFIEEHRDEPFFAFLSFHTVHTPLQAKPEKIEKYQEKIAALGLDTKKEEDPREKAFQNNAAYAAMVEHMDENVGRLLGSLDELRLSDNTIVVWTSDNGGKGSITSNLPLRGMKHNLYEGGIRVPTIVRWPKHIVAGSKSATPLISNDLYPTLLELAGLPLESPQHVDAVSFCNVLLGKSRSVDREAIYWHYPHGRQEAAVRMGQYKLLHRFRDDSVELYDLQEDIGERTDLSEEKPELAQRLLGKLKSWQKSVDAEFEGDEPNGLSFTTVFARGKDGYPDYRIPALVTSKSGTLLAFAEGRQSLSDHACNDIVVKRSTDAGRTWGERMAIHPDRESVFVNPCPVVLDSGRILVMYQRFPYGFHARAMGTNVKILNPGYGDEGTCRTVVTWSDDDGVTWIKPLDVTEQTKRREKINSTATGPGRGLVLTRGKHAGRIVMPTNEGWWEGRTRQFNVYACFSDDGGTSWHYGNPAPNGSQGFGNEVQMVELSDGSVMLNSRHNQGNGLRKVAISQDGGQTWSPLRDDPALTAPGCQGTILRYSFGDGKDNCILFANPNSGKGRKNGTVRVSYDDGKSWPVSRVLQPSFYAYSCLTKLRDGSVGLLYEAAGYEEIRFARFDICWLER